MSGGKHITSNPSAELPGSVIGAPIRIPHIMICGAGERTCGKTWIANTEAQLPVKLAEQRDHQATCKGGLIIATGMGSIR